MNDTLLHLFTFTFFGMFFLREQTHKFEVFTEKSTEIKNERVLEESGG